ncbi:ribonuclease H-like domain-containing protein [Tanacetum coccineum]
MAGSDDENPPPPPQQQTPTQQAPHIVSTIKLPILKKGEYDIWAMKMEHYLSRTDYPIWEVIQKGNGPVNVSTDTNGVIKVLPPKTVKEILARERERKARTTLLMDLPEDHLAKFHKMTDAKEIAQNVAFVSSESTSSTNDVSTAHVVSTYSGYNSQRENSSSYTDESCTPFFAVEGCSLMPKNQLALTRPRLSSSIAITHGTLLESADQKEIKKAEEEMQGTLDIEQNTMGGDLENRRPKASAIQAQTLSFSHLIRDCDFHEKRIAKHVELNKKKGKGTGQGENRPLLLARHILSSKAAKLVHTRALKNKGIVDSGCSRHMTGNKAYLAEYQDYNGGPVAFGGSKGYITGKGKIKIGKLDFEDVCFVKELQHFNLFSVSQICDKKNKVLFTDTECLVLSSDFKLPDENQVLLRIPRQNNMYSFNLENIVPSGGLACLIAKATVDESNKWHRRLGHVNFKNLNKLVKGNLVRGLPSKIFQNDHICVACQKGKQHKASCKAKIVSFISQPLQLLHMDLFGPTSVQEEPNHVRYNNNIDARIDMEADPAQDTLLLQYIRRIQPFWKSLKGLKDKKRRLMMQLKLRKEFAQEAEDLLLQAGAARATSTNTVNTVRTPVSTASSSGGPSYPDLTNYADQDNSQIPALQDIYGNSNDGIFTNASYDDEGAVADFTNLESTMNVSPFHFRIQLFSTLIILAIQNQQFKQGAK